MQTKSFRLSTPLTGRKYVKESDLCVSPISIATYNLTRLHTMLTGLKNAPSEKLEQILRSVVSLVFSFGCYRFAIRGNINHYGFRACFDIAK